MRNFLGVRLQTRTLLSSNPPDSRLESFDILTEFKLQETYKKFIKEKKEHPYFIIISF